MANQPNESELYFVRRKTVQIDTTTNIAEIQYNLLGPKGTLTMKMDKEVAKAVDFMLFNPNKLVPESINTVALCSASECTKSTITQQVWKKEEDPFFNL